MDILKIKKNGSNKKTTFLIGIGSIAFSLLAKIIFKNYYVYGICPVWIFFLLIGLFLFISGIASEIKYNKSFKKYSKEYIDKVNEELKEDYKNLYGVYFTKNYLICTLNEFNILEYKDIKKVVYHLVSDKKFISVLMQDEKIITVLNSNMDACKEVMDYILSKNNKIKKCYDNINNEVKE